MNENVFFNRYFELKREKFPGCAYYLKDVEQEIIKILSHEFEISEERVIQKINNHLEEDKKVESYNQKDLSLIAIFFTSDERATILIVKNFRVSDKCYVIDYPHLSL